MTHPFSYRLQVAIRAVLLSFCLIPVVLQADYAPEGVAVLWADPDRTEESGDILSLRGDWEQNQSSETDAWLQKLLPLKHFEDPVLLVANTGVDRVEVFLGEKLLYSFGTLKAGFARPRAANAVHWIPLPANAPGKRLQLRLRSRSAFTLTDDRPMVLYASAMQLMRYRHRAAAGMIVLSLLFVMVGLYAFFAWAIRRRYGVRFSLWFALLTFTMGSGLLMASVMEFLSPLHSAQIYYPAFFMMGFMPVALWRYMEESLGEGPWRMVRRCWQLQVLACLGLWIPDLFGWKSFGFGAQLVGNGVLAVQLIVGVVEGGRHVRKQDPSTRWIAWGIFLFSVTGLIDVFVALVFMHSWFELYPFGALALVGLLAYDQERAAGEAQRTLRRQAEALHRHQTQLEELVEARTAQWREATRAAEAASHAKSEFLSNMSHELRTPLNAILGHAQLLRADDRVGDTVRDRGEVIRQSGEHLLTLINDVLDLARVEAGRLEVQKGEVELIPLLSGVVEMLRPRAEQKGLEFCLQAATALPARIEGDERRLRQILINLLGNAMKFTDRGRVVLDVHLAEGGLECRVIDSGSGLAPGEIDRLFQPFEQSEGAKEKEGTGLGLPISRALAQKMGGDIEVTSAPGKGSTFCFHFPCRALNKEVAQLPEARTFRHPPIERPDPLPADYQTLCDAVRIGDIEGMLTEIQRLRPLHPGQLDFLDKLEALTHGFEIFSLQQLLDIRS
ncbi:ATP-binding protein [Kiritimatiellaeota bacterium B1221]|nr:ATP-binding protein [Kiritimatiellaeota bacterium B1221]